MIAALLPEVEQAANIKISELTETARKSLAADLTSTKASTEAVISSTMTAQGVLAGLGLLRCVHGRLRRDDGGAANHHSHRPTNTSSKSHEHRSR